MTTRHFLEIAWTAAPEPEDAGLTRLVEAALEDLASEAAGDPERFIEQAAVFLERRADRDALIERLRARLHPPADVESEVRGPPPPVGGESSETGAE